MAKKAKNDETLKVPTTHLTSEDIEDLKGDDFQDSEEGIEAALVTSSTGTPVSLAAHTKEIRAKRKAEGKSTRVMDSEAKKSYALTRLTTALESRGWTNKEGGIFELSDHKLTINTEAFKAEVDGYELPLGDGALKILDQYVSLAKVEAAQA